MSLLFSPWVLGAPGHGLNLANRLVVAPMCQYAADHGQATDWHLFHWANLLNSGAGLVVLEATAVVPEGRISPGCLGLWNDATEAAFTQHLQRARALAPPVPVCLQLAHAGRKASSALPWHGGALLNPAQGGWPTVAPSAVPHLPDETPPHARQELRGERTGIRYHLGTRVQVQVSRVDLDGRRIDFRLVQEGEERPLRAGKDRAAVAPASEAGSDARQKAPKRAARPPRSGRDGAASAGEGRGKAPADRGRSSSERKRDGGRPKSRKSKR